MTTIWAHTLIKNEERYIWYAVMSIIKHVDKILLWDTGSTDKTVQIIKEIQKIYPKKVSFKEIGEVDIGKFTKVRQEMLEETKSDWFIVVDGDEVWWEDAVAEITENIKRHGNKIEAIVSRYWNVVGDIYHYQEEAAGMYEIDQKKGHLTIRAINRKILGLNVAKPHGKQGFFDRNGKLIQERSAKKRIFIDKPAYLHFTHMPRTESRDFDKDVPKRIAKLKYEIGNSFPRDFYYPEVFFEPRPLIVPSPWESMDLYFWIKSSILTVPRRIKRRLIKSESGY